MVGRSSLILLAAFAIVLPHGGAGARTRIPFKASIRTIADQIPQKVNALI
jgi:hypothetical protein